MTDGGVLDGMRVIVTGASRGLGRAIALACGARGAIVGLAYHRAEAAARATAAELGANAILLPFDVGDAAASAAAIRGFVDRTGGLDALVNNAAIVRPSLLITAADADVEAVLRTNVAGVIACTRAALEPMLRQRRGLIVNVGSVVAAQPSRGQAVYAASKGAIEAFTRAVAVEYGRKGVTCVCLSPGPMDTDMFAPTKELGGATVLDRTPWTRFVPVDHVAALAVRLIGGGMSVANGSIVTVDGTAASSEAAG